MSKLFDVIHHRGCEIAHRRALKRHPDYADREARREAGGSGNTKLMSDGNPDSDISVDSFFQDMRLTDRYKPWWHKTTLHVHWWLGKHGPRATRNNLRAFWQRGRRGWADRDTWNLDSYLARVISGSLGYFGSPEHLHGYPSSMTYEEWQQVIKEIAEGMDAHCALSDVYDADARQPLEASRDLAFDHLKKHFGSLWD